MKRKLIIIFSLTLFICVSLIVGRSIAKYIKERDFDGTITTDKFYFTLNLLGDTNINSDLSKTYHLYGGDSKSVEFKIQNFFDSLRYNESEIEYNVQLVETGSGNFATFKINNQNITSGKLAAGSNKFDTCNVVISEGYQNNHQVKFIVSSTKPYTKKLELIFELHTYEADLNVDIIDNSKSMYAELLIECNVNVSEKAVIIDYSNINATSNALQLDMTNSYILDSDLSLTTNAIKNGESYLKGFTVTRGFVVGESVSILLFKTDISKNYSNCDIEIVSTTVDGKTIYNVTIVEGGE